MRRAVRDEYTEKRVGSLIFTNPSAAKSANFTPFLRTE